MRYLSIDLEFIRSDAWQDSTDRQKTVWLNLLAYCASEENGGIIIECEDWPAIKWLAKAKVQRGIVTTDSPLWFWQYGNLNVIGYPTKQEHALKAKRLSCKIGGLSQSVAKRQASAINGKRGGRPKAKPQNPT